VTCQRIQPRRQLGPPCRRTKQGCYLQSGIGASTKRYPGQRDGQQRRRHGTEASPLLAQACEAMLVGRCRVAGRRRSTRPSESVDQEGVDVGDECHWTSLSFNTRSASWKFAWVCFLKGQGKYKMDIWRASGYNMLGCCKNLELNSHY
jgi:hypothetical protein